MRWQFFPDAEEEDPVVTLEATVDGTSGSTSTNLDTTVTIPAGSNRLLVDLIGFTLGTTISSWALDPAGANEALTQFTGSPKDSDTSDEGLGAAFLDETGIAAVGTGSKVSRAAIANTRRRGRQLWVFSGAAQTTPPSANNNIVGGALTVTLTGTFEAGTYLLAGMYGQAAGAYTISGTGGLVEIQDATVATDIDQFVSAGKLLTGQVVDPTVVFTRDAGGSVRKAGFLIAIEPAA
jgi:hypothetical protein